MEGQSIVSDRLKFQEIRTKYKATNEPVDWPSLKLITSANDYGLIFIGFRDKTLKTVSIDQILVPRKTICTNQFIDTYNLTFIPTLLSIARNGFSSVLLASGYNEISNCPVVEFFDIGSKSSIGKVELNELVGTRIVDYAWQPVYYESIVALCTDKGHLLVVGFSKREKRASLVFQDQQYGALSCCWSPKGKNLAIGTLTGKILRLEPVITTSSFTFKEVKNSTITFEHPNITPHHQLIKLRWIIKTSLVCAHARPDAPGTIYSITNVKPGKPYKYWTNLCYEKENPHNNVELVNLSSSIIGSSSSSSETAVLSSDSSEEAVINEPNNWNSVVIDEEGGRIELPLDDDNRETSSRGVTVAFSRSNINPDIGNRPVLVYYTSDGFLCPFIAIHVNNILRLPETQQLEECPLSIPKPVDVEPSVNLLVDNFMIEQKKPEVVQKLAQEPKTINFSAGPAIKQIEEGISSIRQGIEHNAKFLSKLNEINQLRAQFDEIYGIQKAARDVLDNIKADIDKLDLGILEDRYLLSICSKGASKKRSPSPRTMEKVEAIKRKSKEISEKLREVNAHVDMTWEDYVRRRKALEGKDRRLNSLDLIYKTLSNNQKIIIFLKKKSATLALSPPTPKPIQRVETNRKQNPKMRAIREFLASRNTVPVRRQLSR